MTGDDLITLVTEAPTTTTDATVKDTWLRARRADLAEAYGPSGLGPYAPAGDPVWERIFSKGERS